jgi:hypothetical protein
MSHLPGLIAVPAMELVPTPFALKLIELVQRLPAGSRVLFDTLGGEVARKRNRLVREMLLTEPAFGWLLFLDSDQRVAADTVERLLAHDVAIVGALCVRKRPPPVACVWPLEGDEVSDTTPHLEALGDRVGSWPNGVAQCSGRLRLGGLQPVRAIGAGCLLVRRIVFEALPRPWFVSERDQDGTGLGEDLNFCLAAAAAGFPSYCDTELVSGHFTMLAMTPALAAVLPAEALTAADW